MHLNNLPATNLLNEENVSYIMKCMTVTNVKIECFPKCIRWNAL